METTKKARIAYCGEALTSGQMDVRDLAPALLAFADFIGNSNRVLGGKHKIRVLLNQDSIRRGSFDITMLLERSILEQAQMLVGLAEETGFSDLMTVLEWGGTAKAIGGGIGCGIFWLIKKIRDRAITGVRHKEDNSAELTLEDGETIQVPEQTLKIYMDVNCRINIEKIIEPLKEQGVDGFEVRNPEKPDDYAPVVRVGKQEAPYFSAPPAAEVSVEPLQSCESEMLARIIYANFDEGKWKLHNGDNAFWADIQDEDFARKVETREIAFAKGDMLRVRYFTMQAVKEGKLSTDYIVTKVIEVYQKPTQIKLNLQS